MDVVQVHHIGAVLIEHGLKTGPHVTQAQSAFHGPHHVAHATAKVHLAGKHGLITGHQVLRILHGIDLGLHPVVTEQRLGIQDNDAIAASRIIKLIDQ